MALIKCPECGREISSFSELCIHCGYPLNKMSTEESNNNNIKKSLVLVNCGAAKVHCTILVERHCGISLKEAKDICDSPNEEVLLSDTDMNKLESYKQMFEDNGCTVRIVNYGDKLGMKSSYRQSATYANSNKPKCPTCGSTNIEKISITQKVTGGFLFGIFSSNVRNTMHCKDCGYKF